MEGGVNASAHGAKEGIVHPLRWVRLSFRCRNERMDGDLVAQMAFLRGEIGLVMKRLACVADPPCPIRRDPVAKPCRLPGSCPYACLFESPSRPGFPLLRTRSHQPHPLMFSLESLPPGSDATHDLTATLVGWPRHFHPLVALSVLEVLDPREHRRHRPPHLQLVSWSFHRFSEHDLQQGSSPGSVTLRFLSPLRILSQGRVMGSFEVETFFLRLLERLDALATFYGREDGQVVESSRFRTLASDVAAISVSHEDIRRERVRTKTGAHDDPLWLDGIVGEVTLAGIPPSLWLALRLGEALQVGKDTIKGCGRYRLEVQE